MSDTIKILIVEDDMIIGAKISVQLAEAGYTIMGVVPKGEAAISSIENEKPDLVLMDINLSGELDGVQTASIIKDRFQVPIIFLTANADDATFDSARKTNPLSFITKPFKQKELLRAIILGIGQLAEREGRTTEVDNEETTPEKEQAFILSDRIFVRFKERMVKIFISDIYYIEADRSYCKIFAKEKEYLLSIPLKNLENKLNSEALLRIHRSFIINLYHIDEVTDNYVIVAKKTIPVSRSYKDDLRRRIQLIR